MNIKEIKMLLEQAKSKEEEHELLDKIMEEYPDMTIKEAMDMGFSYFDIIFG